MQTIIISGPKMEYNIKNTDSNAMFICNYINIAITYWTTYIILCR